MAHARLHDHSNVLDGSPIALAGVPNLPASKITSEQFPLDRMPRGVDGHVLTGTGVGSNPAYEAVDISAAVEGESSGLREEHGPTAIVFVGAQVATNYTISYATAFSATPNVVANAQYASTGMGIGFWDQGTDALFRELYSVATGSFVVRTRAAEAGTLNIHWIAIGS